MVASGQYRNIVKRLPYYRKYIAIVSRLPGMDTDSVARVDVPQVRFSRTRHARDQSGLNLVVRKS